jgi:endo-1,3(4)-beta-glucanase
MASPNIFAAPISTGPPPSNIRSRDDHPVPRKGITSGFPLQTNKFYSNFFLDNQAAPTFTFPYSLFWPAGRGSANSYGLSVSHIDSNQRVFGQPKEQTGAAAFYFNPNDIQSLILSAKELGIDTVVTTDTMTASSAMVRLRKNSGSEPAVSFPLVQGMGFVTAIYNGGVPLIQTGVFFRTVTRVNQSPKSNVSKFRLLLEDGKTWWLYAYKVQGEDLDINVRDNRDAEATRPFYGIIQVAKDSPGAESLLDRASGVYAETAQLSGSVSGSSGQYSFKFTARGHPEGDLLMWALPHHVESFDQDTRARTADVYMQTTTKGVARAVMATQWTMVEPQIPVDMGFAPYSPDQGGSKEVLSDKAKSVISVVARNEISQNMMDQSNLDSMYFSGKVRRPGSSGLLVIEQMLTLYRCRLLPSLR